MESTALPFLILSVSIGSAVAADKPVHVFILSGQSSMSMGRLRRSERQRERRRQA